MPLSTRYFTPQVTSSCIFRPHCWLPAFEEFLAITGGGAEVRAQHRIAAVGKELRVSVVAPGIAAPRPAVRERLWLAGSWPGHLSATSDMPESPARLTICNAPASILASDSRGSFSRTTILLCQLVRFAVENICLARLGVAVSGDHPGLFVACARSQRQLPLPGSLLCSHL